MKIRKCDLSSSWSEPIWGYDKNDFAYDREAVLYLVLYNLRTWLEEYFLDKDIGVAYLQKILTRPANINLTVSELKRVILKTDGVYSLHKFDYEYDYNTRKFSYTFVIITDFDIDDSGVVIDQDFENYPISYNDNGSGYPYWELSISKLGINTRLYKPDGNAII